MAKQNYKGTDVDEDAIRELVASQGREGSVLNVTPEEVNKREEGLEIDIRRKRISLPDFEDTFMQDSRIPRKHVIYINDNLKRIISDVVRELGDGRVSLAGYVENIIEQHLEMYRDEINRRHKASRRDKIL